MAFHLGEMMTPQLFLNAVESKSAGRLDTTSSRGSKNWPSTRPLSFLKALVSPPNFEVDLLL